MLLRSAYLNEYQSFNGVLPLAARFSLRNEHSFDPKTQSLEITMHRPAGVTVTAITTCGGGGGGGGMEAA